MSIDPRSNSTPNREDNVKPLSNQVASGSFIAQADRGGTATVNVYQNLVRRQNITEILSRKRILQKVHSFWIRGVLEKSLLGAAMIELGMDLNLDAVEPQWGTSVDSSQTGTPQLPPRTKPIDIFDEFGGELLILGLPGSGKTTTLLQLADSLLQRAEKDPAHSIPIVFNLSSYARGQALEDWLVSEMNHQYDIPPKIAMEWVNRDQLILLLDGLDEVRKLHRAACVDAINTFRKEHGLVEVIVCSRSNEYADVNKKLRLSNTLFIKPLSIDQVEYYLAQGGDQFEKSRAALLADPELQELLQSPLTLAIFIFAYSHSPWANLLVAGTIEEKRKILVDTYVEAMLNRRKDRTGFSPVESKRWLKWLALLMARNGQTVFRLEQLQPYCLEIRDQTKFNRIFLTFVTVLWPLFTLPTLTQPQARPDITHISVIETVDISLSLILTSLVLGLVATLIIIPIFALAALFQNLSWASNWYYIPLAVLSIMLLGIFGGLRSGKEVSKSIPNEGIWRSARVALAILFSAGFLTSLLGAVFGLFTNRPFQGVIAGLMIGLLFGIGFGLRNGGLAFLQHFLLRYFLYREGNAPWRYSEFLDFAADHLLMQKVGGGFIFVHRLLLEYLVSKDQGVSPLFDLISLSELESAIRNILPETPQSDILFLTHLLTDALNGVISPPETQILIAENRQICSLLINLNKNVLNFKKISLGFETDVERDEMSITASDAITRDHIYNLSIPFSTLARSLVLKFDQFDPKSMIDSMAIAIVNRIAYFDVNEELPLELIGLASMNKSEGVLDQTLVKDAVTKLTVLGFVQKISDTTVKINPIIAKYLQESNTNSSDRQHAEEAILAMLSETGRMYTFAEATQIQTQLKALTRSFEQRRDLRFKRLLNELGFVLLTTGDYHQSANYLKHALAISAGSEHKDQPLMSDIYENLGILRFVQRDYASMRYFLEHASAYVKLRSSDDEITAVRVSLKRAMLRALESSFTEGSFELEACLATAEKTFGEVHPNTARTLLAMGIFMFLKKEDFKAKEYLERALQVTQKVSGRNSIEIAQVHFGIGFLSYSRREFSEAASHLQQGLDITTQVLGPTHPEVDDVLLILDFVRFAGGTRSEGDRLDERWIASVGNRSLRTKLLRPFQISWAPSRLRDSRLSLWLLFWDHWYPAI